MNIVFAGTPDFAVASLKALHESRHQVVAVYTQPDRPAGRGRKLQPSPVKQYALEHELVVHQPESLKDPAEIEHLAALHPDLMVVVAYGLLLPQEVLEIPRLGCINVHASLLPRWRGAAPIQRAIEAGDAVTGVTIMQMDAGLDTGDMLAKLETPIVDDDTAASLHDRLAKLGATALSQTLEQIESGTVSAEKQQESAASYAQKLTKTEAEIDWSLPANAIARKIRAFNPWPMACSSLRGKRLRILEAHATAGDGRRPGTVSELGDEISVVTGDGQLQIHRLQLEGGRAQSVKEFLNGHPLKPGDRLGS